MTLRPETLHRRADRDPADVTAAAPAGTLEAFPREAAVVGETLRALDGERRADAAAAVAEHLSHEDVDVRRGAALALRNCFETHPVAGLETASELAAALAQDDHVVRKHAGTALRDVALERPQAAVTAADSLPHLLDPDGPDLLSVGLDTAAVVAETDPDAAVALLDPLLETTRGLADRAVDASPVDGVETEAPRAVQEFRSQYETETGRQRGRAVTVVTTVLTERPGAAASVRDGLRGALRHRGLGIDRAAVAEAIGQVAESDPAAATPVVDDLAACLDDRDRTVAASAAWALGILAEARGQRVVDATEDCVHALAALLEADASGARIAGATLLSYVAEYRPAAASAVTDSLVTALDDEESDVRASAALALGHAGTRHVVPALRDLAAADPREQVRAIASASVERIEADA